MNNMFNDKKLQQAVITVLKGKVEEAKKPLHPNQQKLDVHEPEKDELTARDFAMLRAGKKAKMKEEVNVEDLEMVIEYALSEGWEDMLKAAKERNKPQPSGGAGFKPGRAYGGSKQKEEKPAKPMKEDTEYTFGDYLQAAKAKYSEEEAIKIANDAFNNKDISIFSSTPEA